MRVAAAARLKVRTDYFEHRSAPDALRRIAPAVRAAVVSKERSFAHAAILTISFGSALASVFFHV
jgi:hypothetical protein